MFYKTCIKEFAHVLVGAGMFKSCRADWKLMQDLFSVLSLNSKGRTQDFYDTVFRQNFFVSRKLQFSLLRPSTDWMRSTHIIEDNYLYLNTI